MGAKAGLCTCSRCLIISRGLILFTSTRATLCATTWCRRSSKPTTRMAKAEIQQLRLDEAGERSAVETALPMARIQRWKAIAAAAGCYLLTCAVFLFFFYTPPYNATEGQPAGQTV